MPSTYSSSLRLELQATGENANTWGVKTNNNLNLVQQAITGYRSINISGNASYTVSAADGVSDEARNAVLNLTGTVTSAISVVVPDVAKTYWVRCQASGANVTFRTSAGTGVVLPRDIWVFLVIDGTSVVNAMLPYVQLSAANVFTNTNTFASATTFTGPVSVSASAAFTLPVTINAPLSVTGAATFTSAVAVQAPLSVTGAAVFTSIVNVSKALTVAATVESTTGGFKFPDGTLQATAVTSAARMVAGTALVLDPIAVNTRTTQTHGLSATPTFFTTYLECKSAEYNFSAGDRIILNAGVNVISGSTIVLQVRADTSATYLEIANNSLPGVVNKTAVPPGSANTITAANWLVRVIPYALV